MKAQHSRGTTAIRRIAALLAAWLAPLAAAQSVNVWLTTADQTKLLQAQAITAFGVAAAVDNPVIVDESQVYQTMEGFGGSFTDSSAYLLHQVVPAANRAAVMNNLFTRTGDGIGLSFVRNPMGACDYSRSVYSYDDMGMGMMDQGMANFSMAHDLDDVVPLMQQALQLNPQLKVMANPWSPPGWMKSTGSMLKGTLRTDAYDAFAAYFVKYIQACAAQGIPVHYISLQNEPLYEPTGYPGMLMDAATQTVVLRDHVLPALTAAHLTTKVLLYDHNWDRTDYPLQCLADPVLAASPQVAGTAWHGYGGPPGAMLALATKHPALGNYMTEHSGGTWIGNQLKQDFEEIIHCLRSSARAYVKWNLALDQNRGPFTSIGATSTCSALLTVNTGTGAVTYNLEYYTLGHFSRFILPGAKRVYSTNAAGIVDAAFVNPDGSRVLVAYNDSPSSRNFQVRWGGRQFSYTLAASSAATFTWSGTPSGANALDAQLPIQAASFSTVSGLQTETAGDVQGGYNLGYADNGDYAVYPGVDFGTGLASVSVRLASQVGAGTMEFRLDSPTGPRIAALAIPATGGWQAWQTFTTGVAGASGKHDLYVVFTGGTGNGTANVNWFQFGMTASAVAPQMNMAAYTQTVMAGHKTTFHAAATGYPAVSFQWQVSLNNGASWTDLSEGAGAAGTATDTLTLANVTADMNGRQYRVMATNSAGSAASAAFTLNVLSVLFPSPAGLASDGTGTFWVCDNSANTIHQVTAAGVATLLAGASGQQGSTDGTGAAALFRQPGGMAIDSAGNCYVVDTGNSLIRKVTSTGIVTTFAGSAANQGWRDGTGTDAWFNQPSALCLDGAGNLYVADTGNSVIRKVTSAGVVTTLAGTAGLRGSADGTGAAARFNQPSGIALDGAGNLCVADTLNQTIRRITPTGVVTTWVGLAGVSGVSDGAGADALFNQPMGLCFDGSGNLYVADMGNASIRAVTPAGVVSTLAGLSSISGMMDGMGTAAWFNAPRDVKYAGTGALYVADNGNAAIRKVTLAGSVSTLSVAAASTGGGSGGGTTPTPTPTPAPSGGGGGGGGGGAPSWVFLSLLLVLLRMRQADDRKSGNR